MKLSYEWIKEYVNPGMKAEDLAERLTMSGSEVESLEKTGDDVIMDLEITSNRPDCLNMIGLARDISGVVDVDLKVPSMELPEQDACKDDRTYECSIEAPGLCSYYSARIVLGVKVSGSGGHVAKRITSLGLRAVNNIVDITNFCLMEIGQPLHAFDMDRIRGNRIIIREAEKGEKILTIDEVERALEPGMLVIADEKGPIAVAGVMGGKETEVTEDTKNVLLESAYFDPVSVRRTARILGLSSDSSYRFERGVDKGMVVKAQNRAASMISRECGGSISGFIEDGKIEIEEVTVGLDVEKAARVLGMDLDPLEVKGLLTRLGMKVQDVRDKKLKVDVPSFREDIRQEVDLFEEIARIKGYDKIPVSIPKCVPSMDRKDHRRKVDDRIREILPAMGFNEIMTYSLISEEAVKRFPGLEDNAVALSNPLSEEQKILTPQLMDGMLHTVSWNINRKNRDLFFFEMGKLYSSMTGGYAEVPAVSLGITGRLRKNWKEGDRNADLYDIKGFIETLFDRLKVPIVFLPGGPEFMENCSYVVSQKNDEKIGFFGEAGNNTLADYDIEQKVFLGQIKFDVICEIAVLKDIYRPVPKYPGSNRDISVLCEATSAAADIEEVIRTADTGIFREVELIDLYDGEQVPRGKKSLTFSIRYGVDDRTLKEEEIEAAHALVKDLLVRKLGVEFR